jgi:hypothetical protein
MNNTYGAYADAAYSTSTIESFYNIYFGNTTNRIGINSGNNVGHVTSVSDCDNCDPKFVDNNGDYCLQPGSPCIEAGNPSPVDQNPDGTRNDSGVYGGPGSAAFRCNSAGLPVVTNLSATPHDVVKGDTFTLTGVGTAQ